MRPKIGWAHRYVGAHFSLLSSEERELWASQLDTFASTLSEFIHSHYFVELPFLRKRDYLREFAQIWGLKFAYGLLALLLENQRLYEFSYIIKVWKKLYYKSMNQRIVRITVPQKTPVRQINAFLKKVGIPVKESHIEVSVNPKILGGAIVETEGRCYDLSYQNKIKRIQRKLLNESF